MKLTHTPLLKLETQDGVMLCTMKSPEGKITYLHIKADKEIIKQMYRDYELKKQVNFADYGEILYSGDAPEPPQP